MKQNIIVLAVNPYSMNNNGSVVEGVSVSYLTTDSLEPVRNGESLGSRPAKANLPYAWKDLFPSAPALYEAEMLLQVGSDGKPVMKITHIDYVSNLSLSANSPKSTSK